MKNIFKSFLMLLSGAMLFASCQEEAAPLASAISVDKQELTFAGASAEAQKVKVKAEGEWFVLSSEEWVTVKPAYGNGDTDVTITVADNVDSYNELEGPRSTVVNFCYGTTGVTPVTVKQLGENGLDASRTYKKVTSAEQVVAGGYLVVFEYEKDGEAKIVALDPLSAATEDTYKYAYASDVVIENDVITMPNGNNSWIFETAEGGFYIQTAGKYLFQDGSGFKATTDKAKAHVWSVAIGEDGFATITNISFQNRWIQFSITHNSAGAYDSAQSNAAMPVLYVDSAPPTDEVLDVKNTTVPAFATEVKIKVTANKAWTVRNHDSWIKSFTKSGENNGEIVVTFDAYTSTTEERTAKFQVIGQGTNTWVTLTQSKVAPNMTVAEFLAEDVVKGDYAILTGSIENIQRKDYGNFYLQDETGIVYIYGLYDVNGGKVFTPLGLKEGDIVTVYGKKDVYKENPPQLANGVYISHVSSKIRRKLAFSAESAEATLGNAFTAPSLSGETVGVVYSSSKPEVATVNASTGEVTLVAVGNTTITATGPETETHLAGTASYALTVSSKLTRALEFSAATASATLGEAFTAPTLSGVTEGVVYSSSNTAVATVDAATGAVTLVGAGETTITAAAPESETHLAGTATYTLTVADLSPVTIASVLALGNGATITANTFVEGVVISNMDLNNLTSKRGMYIQDETAGLQLFLAANHEFKFGDKVKVDLSGAKVGAYSGAVQISGLALNKITKISSGNTVTPKTVTIDDFLDNKYEGQYVAIEGVQVAESDLAKTFVMGSAHTSIKMENADGKNFVVFSSKYATYGATAVPQGSGTIKGISSINNGNMQIIFAQNSDYAGLTGERFGQGTTEPEPEPEQPGTPVTANRADFETLSRTSKYAEYKTTAGWVLTNCAVQEGNTADSNPQYILIGKVPGTDTWAKAACMNGKTSAVGSIESPEITGGCGTLEFDFAHIFSDKNGMDFNIDVVQNNAVVKTIHVTRTATEAAKMTKMHFSEAVNVSGTFKLKFTNNCPTKKDGNADRVSIWNLTWTSVQ